MAGGWITFLKGLASGVPTPDTNQVSVFVDDTSGEPSYKDDTGTVTSLVGPAGPGVPVGGTTGQVLEKIDGTDYNTQWATPSSGVSLGNVNVFTKNQSVATGALTDGANIATDASLSNNFKVTLGGNRTLDNPTNLTEGMILNWIITQDGTGSRTLSYGSKFKWPGGTAPTLSTAAAAVDMISAYYDGTNLLCAINQAFA